jgi:hypothetical protein
MGLILEARNVHSHTHLTFSDLRVGVVETSYCVAWSNKPDSIQPLRFT